MTIWQRITGLATTFGDGKFADRPKPPLSIDGRHTVAFTMAVIALGAKMAKADGVVSPLEIEVFHRVFQTPPDEAKHVSRVFELAQGDIGGFEAYATQVRGLLQGDRQLLRDVLESLFHIATVDRALHPGEDHFLKIVAERFGFSASTYRHIRAQFVEDASAPYDVLGLDPTATDAELKARHRKLVRDNHPDLLIGRGVPAEIVAVATRKLAVINTAYDTLASERDL